MTETEWKKIRSHIIRRDAYRCRVIECTVKGVHNLTVHHIIPRDEGGGDHDANLITLCPKHHDQIEIAGVRVIPLIEAWEDGLSPDTPVVSRTVLDSQQELVQENDNRWSRVHFCDETTIAAVIRLKNETRRAWVDLAKQLGYPASFSATLSAVSRDVPSAISKEGEDELRGRISLTPISPLPTSGGHTEARPQKPSDKPKAPPVYKGAYNTEIAAQMALAHRGLGSWAAVARLCGNHPRTGRPVSAAAAWFYGTGTRPIPDEVAAAWAANVTPSMLKSWAPRQRRPRTCIEVSPETATRLRERKLAGETWDETLTRLMAQGE